MLYKNAEDEANYFGEITRDFLVTKTLPSEFVN